jgi:hypothetical protein
VVFDDHVKPVAIPATEFCGKIAKSVLALSGRHDEADAQEIETTEVIKIGVE